MSKIILMILVIFSTTIISCNGEKERTTEIINKPEPVREESIVRNANFTAKDGIEQNPIKDDHSTDIFGEYNIKDLKEKLKYMDGFILSGNFDLNSFSQDFESCIGLIYKKEFEKSFVYVFVDCHDTVTQTIVMKD